MDDSPPFADPDLWLGSLYELAIELTRGHSDERLRRAFEAMMANPHISGPWRQRGDIGNDVVDVQTLQVRPSPVGYCTLMLPNDHGTLAAKVCSVRETNGSDWLDLCVPAGILGSRFDVNYPMRREDNPWMSLVDDIFRDVADDVYSSVSFELAIIGEECSGLLRASDLTGSQLNTGNVLLPPEMADTLDARCDWRSRPSGLYYVPPDPAQ